MATMCCPFRQTAAMPAGDGRVCSRSRLDAQGTLFAYRHRVKPRTPIVPSELPSIPPPPRVARVDPISCVTGRSEPSVEPTRSPSSSEVDGRERSVSTEPRRNAERPSIDCLLARAQALADSLKVNDPRGRLLQIALMRRDFTLLHAVVSRSDASYSRQARTTWRPSKAGQIVMRITRPSNAPRRVPPHRSIPPRPIRGN